MKKWFTIDTIDEDTYCISEYRHWEETHCYLLNGSEGSLLIDTGLGICDIHEEVEKLTDRPERSRYLGRSLLLEKGRRRCVDN